MNRKAEIVLKRLPIAGLKLCRSLFSLHERTCLLSLMLFFINMISAFAQDYLWPTDASRYLTSTFAEYRTDHFHAGIDIKTNAQCGYRVFAADSGSIVRLVVSPYYYGKAVFLRMDNGMTAVYAHLSGFSDELEAMARSAQMQAGRYGVDIHDSTGFLQVTRGQVIGYTGRTGTQVPHLHFEIDSSGWAVNPLSAGFCVIDTIAPVFTSMAAVPWTYGSHVEGDFEPRFFQVKPMKNDRYQITGTVHCSGSFGLAVSVYDLANGAPNKLNVYALRLEIDGQTVFSGRFDRFPFSETHQVHLDRNYRLNRSGAGLFHNLYREPGNTLPFYRFDRNENGLLYGVSGPEKATGRNGTIEGMPALEEGEHTIRIFASDIMGNTSEAAGILSIQALSEFHSKLHDADSSAATDPIFQNGSGANLFFEYFRNYIRVSIHFDIEPLYPPVLSIRFHDWTDQWIPLFKKGKKVYTGQIPVTRSVSGTLTAVLRYACSPDIEITRFDTLSVCSVEKELPGSIYSEDRKFEIQFPAGSLYERFTGTIQTENFVNANTIGSTYLVCPCEIPLKNRIIVKADVSDQQDCSKLALYRVDNPGHPVFLRSDCMNGCLQASTNILGRYAVFRDTIPPECRLISPGADGSVSPGKRAIAIFARDTLSGIYGEENYRVFLDGIPQIVAYDPEENCLYCGLPPSETAGPHTLTFFVRDRADNITEGTSVFTISDHGRKAFDPY